MLHAPPPGELIVTVIVRRPLVVLAAALVLGVSAGCGSRSSTVTLGAAGPWSEAFGLMNKRGMELAVDEINARRLLEGQTLRLLDRNDEGDGAKAATIAQEFVDNPDVLAVVGHVTSGAMVAAAKVYDGHLAAVATSATSPDLSGISPWAFRVISSDSTNGLDLARFVGTLGRRRAAILYENDAYGRGLIESFRRNFDGQVVSVDPISAQTSDFEPYVAYYKRVKPDVVFVAGTEVTGIAFLREARRQALDAMYVGGDGWTGIVADTAASEGSYVGAPFTALDPRPEARRFVTAYTRKFGAAPDGNAALGYDATMVLARAIAQAGPDRKRIRDYLASLDAESAYPGVTGPIRFLENGDPVGKSLVMTRVHLGSLLVEKSR